MMQCGAGVLGLLPAASVTCKGIGLRLRVSKPAGDVVNAARAASGLTRTESSGSDLDSSGSSVASLALLLQADADVHSLVSSCCVQTLWPLPAAVQEVEKALRPAQEGSPASDTRGTSGMLETAEEEAAALADAPALAGAASMPRQPSGRPGELLLLHDRQVDGSDATAPPSAAPSPHDAAAESEQARQERSETGGFASGSTIPSPGSAAEAARAAWAAATRSSFAAAAAQADRPGGRRPSGSARLSMAGEPKRTLGLKLSPRSSSNADRLLGRRGLAGSGTLNDDGDDENDGSGGSRVAFLLEWEACVRMDADSRLQLLSRESSVLLACGFQDLDISGKSVTALRLGGLTDRGQQPAKGMRRRGSAAQNEDEEEPQAEGRPGLFTAEFSVQNIVLSIQRAGSEPGAVDKDKADRASMVSLLSASSFYAGVQPTESELMPSANHSGPLLLEGELRTKYTLSLCEVSPQPLQDMFLLLASAIDGRGHSRLKLVAVHSRGTDERVLCGGRLCAAQLGCGCGRLARAADGLCAAEAAL